jgi:LacI family transcriptional regulator
MMELNLGPAIIILRSRQTLRKVQLAARHLLEDGDRPRALFCWTDFVALEVISVVKEMGMSVPEDLAIVSYDNTMYSDFAQNGL